jgi:hypothetical protein
MGYFILYYLKNKSFVRHRISVLSPVYLNRIVAKVYCLENYDILTSDLRLFLAVSI